LFFIPTGSVDDTGFIMLIPLLPSPHSPLYLSPSPPLPAASSCAHWLPPLSVDCYFFNVNGGWSEGNNFVIAFVGLLLHLPPPPPSLPSPLTSLACPSIARCVLGLPSLVDCYF
jgi:hypothetical protein